MNVIFPDLDAVIIFHHEWKAVKRVCDEYLSLYPRGRVLLARDTLPVYQHPMLSGMPVEYLDTYECMEKITHMIWDDRPMGELPLGVRMDIVMNQIFRMKHAAERAQTEFFLVLEYDASVRGRVPIFPDTDIESLDINKYPAWLLEQIRAISGRELGVDGWGFVVGTVRRQLCLDVATWAKNNYSVLQSLVEREPRMVVLDFLYPIVSHLADGKVGNHGLTVECDRDKNWKKSKAPLLHQYRGRHIPKKLRKNNRASS